MATVNFLVVSFKSCVAVLTSTLCLLSFLNWHLRTGNWRGHQEMASTLEQTLG